MKRMNGKNETNEKYLLNGKKRCLNEWTGKKCVKMEEFFSLRMLKTNEKE